MCTPLLFFTFNRPAYTKAALTALGECRRLDEIEIYIFCDGPRDQNDQVAVEQTRQVVKEWTETYCASVYERSNNLGLYDSIVNEVSALCAEYGRVIVVEDDLVVSPHFVDYMLLGLDQYDDNNEVFQINGYMFPFTVKSDNKVFFLRLASTWGWATWQRAWQYYEKDLEFFPEELENIQKQKTFNLGDSYPYDVLLRGKLSGDNSSWGIIWWWTIFKNNALCLFPQTSLVRRGGVDGSGTHCNIDDPYSWEENEIAKDFIVRSSELPNLIKEDRYVFKQIREYLLSLKNSKGKSIFYKLYFLCRRYLIRIWNVK